MKRDYWVIIMSVVIILGASLILIWAFLKAFGIITTPVWVEMIPYFGVGLSILGGSYQLGRIIKGIEETENKINKILRLEGRLQVKH